MSETPMERSVATLTPRIDACIEEYRPGTFDFAWALIGLARQIEYECRANAEMCQINYDRAEKAERELVQAQARIEELKKDAARYRWLADEKLLVALSLVWEAQIPTNTGQTVKAACDAAIDAALKEPK